MDHSFQRGSDLSMGDVLHLNHKREWCSNGAGPNAFKGDSIGGLWSEKNIYGKQSKLSILGLFIWTIAKP